ncbi:ATP-binding protein [Amycolatopsis aidingensis]|uniref:ATP-binding protein n=1 Tax=Amycolatopsis aidingensis TaxID=2842453 RepID=UPI001C0DF828|nr:tetratricopeptide repeat protein [Amycolatopsis aidingensis]
MVSTGERAPGVFVSYAHDSAEHKAQVWEFGRLLEAEGVDVRLDQGDGGRRRDWYVWAMRRITEADFVVVVASPRYREAGNGLVPPGENRGVQTEAALLRDLLHRDRAVWLTRLLPVVLPGRCVDEIPLFLQPYCADHYLVPELSSAGVADLLEVLRAGQAPARPVRGRGRVPPPNASCAPVLRTTAATMAALPRDTAGFTGRQAELNDLLGAVTGPAGHAALLHAVEGMPGVGKTTFAVHAAHLLADRFPDGQLFLHLHGHTPEKQPLEASTALGALLQAVGVAAQQLPCGVEERARMWRDRLAEKKMLVLLDDAAGPEQLQPLLPTAGQCLVLITSRRRLNTLDVRPISLDVLPPGQATEMFFRLARTRADKHDPPAVAELMGLCGHLPLAIALTAGRLRSHPCWTIPYLIGQLSTAQDGLGEVHAGNLAAAAAFDLSYRDLTEDQQRLFRRLGLHPGDQVDAYAAAALDDADLASTRLRLEALYSHHLVQEPAPGRYRLHDLIRDYAGTLAGTDPEAERHRAVGRLVAYYLHTAIVANERVPGHTATVYPARVRPPAHAPELGTEQAALAWLAAERVNLGLCVSYAARSGGGRCAVWLALAMHAFLLLHGHWDHALTVHRRALAAAMDNGDELGQAAILGKLGHVQYMTNDFAAATASLTTARTRYLELGQRQGQADTLADLGRVQHMLRNHPAAAASLRIAHRTYRSLGDELGEADCLTSLGALQHDTGNSADSLASHQRAHELYLKVGNAFGEARSLNSLGALHALHCEYPAAMAKFRRANDLVASLGDTLGEAKTLNNLGIVHHSMGQYPAAVAALTRARALYLRLGERYGEANTLVHLGHTHTVTGNHADARAALDHAHEVLTRAGDSRGEAKALNRLGRLYHAVGDHATALAYFNRARDLYTELGDTRGEAMANAGLGVLRRVRGDYKTALADLTYACTLYSGSHDREGQAETLNSLGDLAFEWPYAGEPFVHYRQALELAREIAVPLEQARALEGTSRCLRRRDRDGAESYLQEAVRLYRQLGIPRPSPS